MWHKAGLVDGRRGSVALQRGEQTRGRHDHVTPLQQQLHWLSVPERVIFKLCFIFSWSQPWILIGGLQARVRDSLSPASAFAQF